MTERQGKLETLLAEGHAGYAEMGQDLVCAGVSCITIGTNNALDELAPGTFQTETREGFLKIRVLKSRGSEDSADSPNSLDSAANHCRELSRIYKT